MVVLFLAIDPGEVQLLASGWLLLKTATPAGIVCNRTMEITESLVQLEIIKHWISTPPYEQTHNFGDVVRSAFVSAGAFFSQSSALGIE